MMQPNISMSEKKIKLEDLTWTGNSELMYQEITDSLPPLFKAAVKKKFEVWVNQNQATTIREWNIKHTIEKYAPAEYAKKLMPIYEKYKSEE